MDVPPLDIGFCCVIAKQTQIEKIRGARQKFERSKISFAERSSICPHPANTIFFQKPNDLRPMPSGVTKFNRETKIVRQLFEKFAKRRLASFRCKGWGELDENNVESWYKPLDGAEKQIQLSGAIAQLAGVCDLAREFTSETK